MSPTDLYTADFYAWTQEQAQLLQAGKLHEIDLEHLLEEIADLGRSEERAIEHQLDRLLLHLLKWHYQPGERSGSWRGSITDARKKLARLGRKNPSLWARRFDMLRECYPDARDVAAAETGLPSTTFPAACPWTVAQVLDDTFWPATSA